MQGNNKGLIIVLVIMASIVLLAFKVKYDWSKDIEIPNSKPIAYIYHDEKLDSENGTKYTYYIYSSKHSYIYIKKEVSVTKDGLSKEKEVENGRLSNREDLKKIKKDIEKDSKSGNYTYIYCSYNDSGNIVSYDSIDKLANVLW